MGKVARPFSRDPYAKWYRNLPICLYLPWRNLGCLGLKVGPFYADLSRRPGHIFPLLYANLRGRRYWIRFWSVSRG